MKNDILEKKPFSDIDINDSFFDSLKEDYAGFDQWFQRKSDSGDYAYTVYQGKSVIGFMYLKDEVGIDETITPDISKYGTRLKVGTFKIDAHGTILGNRFISLILHQFVVGNYDACYVTMFDKISGLDKLFQKFGFSKFGKKNGTNETVLLREKSIKGNIYQDYPRLTLAGDKYLLGIRPKFHTSLFPDAKLRTEKSFYTEDVSATNSITKVFLSNLQGLRNNDLKKNDKLVIYRTSEPGKVAEWNAVATSVATVVDYRNINSFDSYSDFEKFVTRYSIFSDRELYSFWNSKRYPYIIKFVYNVAFPHRIVRHDLIENCGIDREAYSGFIELSDKVFASILEEAKLNEGYVID